MYYIVRTEVEPEKCKLGNEQKNLFYYFVTCQAAVWLVRSNLVIMRFVFILHEINWQINHYSLVKCSVAIHQNCTV